MNLLAETIRAVIASGHTTADVSFVGSADGAYGTSDWSAFAALADLEYDDGFGAAEVATDLVVRFEDGRHLWRYEYDGSESWDFDMPHVETGTVPQPLTRVIGRLWPTVADLHSSDPADDYHRRGDTA